MPPVIVTVRVSERSGLLAEARGPGLPEPSLLACPVGEDTSPRAAGCGVAQETFARTQTAPFLHDPLCTRHHHSLGAGDPGPVLGPSTHRRAWGSDLGWASASSSLKMGAVGAPS